MTGYVPGGSLGTNLSCHQPTRCSCRQRTESRWTRPPSRSFLSRVSFSVALRQYGSRKQRLLPEGQGTLEFQMRIVPATSHVHTLISSLDEPGTSSIPDMTFLCFFSVLTFFHSLLAFCFRGKLVTQGLPLDHAPSPSFWAGRCERLCRWPPIRNHRLQPCC